MSSSNKRSHENEKGGPSKSRKTILDNDILSTIAQRDVSGRGSPVMNEPVVEQDVIGDMEKVVNDGDLRNLVGLKPCSVIELKWSYEHEGKDDEVKWELATIHKYDTGRTHRVYDVDDEENRNDDTEFQDIPVVSIHYESDKDVYHDICIIGDHLVLDVTTGNVLSWRFYGDTYDSGDEEEEVGDGDTVLMVCENNDDLKRQIDELVPKIFINVLEKYRSHVNGMSHEAIAFFTSATLEFKAQLSENIYKFFTENGTMKDGSVMCLAREDIDTIIKKCLEENI